MLDISHTNPLITLENLTHHRIGCSEQVTQQIDESLILYQHWVDVVKLGHAHSSRLLHVRILVLETLAERLAEVLCDLVHADASHGAHGQGTDQRVGVLTVLTNTMIITIINKYGNDFDDICYPWKTPSSQILQNNTNVPLYTCIWIEDTYSESFQVGC